MEQDTESEGPPVTSNINSLGELVSLHRERKRWSMSKAAREAGIDVTTYVRMERGEYLAPSPLTLKGIARALDIPLFMLFKAAGYMTPQDLVDMVQSTKLSELRGARNVRRLRNDTVARLIEEYGLDAAPPEFAPEN